MKMSCLFKVQTYAFQPFHSIIWPGRVNYYVNTLIATFYAILHPSPILDSDPILLQRHCFYEYSDVQTSYPEQRQFLHCEVHAGPLKDFFAVTIRSAHFPTSILPVKSPIPAIFALHSSP